MMNAPIHVTPTGMVIGRAYGLVKGYPTASEAERDFLVEKLAAALDDLTASED